MQKILLKYSHTFIKILPVIIFIFLLFENHNAQSSSVKIIDYQNQSLRELSKEYLGNPDYWETILQFNNFDSITELKNGEKLKIPIGLVSSTLMKMDEVKSKISDANSNGAKVLTPELITEAEINFGKILSLKQQGDWKVAYDSLHDVLKLANESLRLVRLLRESSANATISFANGDVEKRKPAEKLWSDAELYTKLYEADRARTMSNSVAEITFIDLSRIRLNENSQALIQHSRIDLLKNKTETKVKLVKGDAFAYLLKSPKKKFDLDIPGINVKIKSKNFWVEKKSVSTKIANYDGEIELGTKDVTVVVKENQGSIIPDGGVPSEPKDLLPSPSLVSPKNLEKFFEDNIEFYWEEVKDAKQYWFELSNDASFKNVIFSNKNITGNRTKVKKLSVGIYYWHVCSIDKLGFPGKFSNQKSIILSEDVARPFMVVTSPQNREVTKLEFISITGVSEPGLELSINNKLLNPDKNGEFTSEVLLNEGQNIFFITSKDESGNITEIIRTVFYESSDQVKNIISNKNFYLDQNTFIVNDSEFRINGKTRPLSHIKFYLDEKEAFGYADTNGIYSLKIDISNKSKILNQVITTPAGYTTTLEYRILLDTKKPILNITSVIPKFTKDKLLKLEGNLIEGDSLFINSELLNVANNKFEQNINLVEGDNNFEIVAFDIAGNREYKNISIIKDSTPPKILSHELVRESKKNNEYFIKVTASDISGLIKTAVVTVNIDGVDKNIILKLTNNDVYSKNIFSNSSSSKVFIKYILLEDYIGNSKKYKIK